MAVITPDGSVYSFDDGAGVWRHIPDVDTANAMGLDWNSLDAMDAPPGPVGDDWPSVDQGGGSPAPAPEPAPEPAPAPSETPPPAPGPSGPLGDVILPDGSVYRFDAGLGAWRHIPDVDTATAMGVDFNNLTRVDQLPGNAGPDWPSLAPPPPPAATPPPSPPSPATGGGAGGGSTSPPPPPTPQAISWGGRTWTADDLTAFIAYLRAHGTDYSTWANNHPDAAAVLEGPPTDPSREPVPKSIGEALVDYLQAGSSPAEAAAQTEALRAALVAQGVSAVTPAQLLGDATFAAQTLADEASTAPPAGEPTVTPPPTGPARELEAVDATQREHGDLSNLPPIPAGFRTIANDSVTEGLVVAAALIEHADVWIMLGTCKAESGFNVDTTANSSGAAGPMQVVGFTPYSASIPLVEWAWGNLIAGARLLAKYEAIYNGNQQKMSAAYNAGTGAVNAHWPQVLQWLEVPKHPEDGTVQDYVDKVAKIADDYAGAFGGGWNIDPATGKLIHGVPGPVVGISTGAPSSAPAGVNAQWRNLMTAVGSTSYQRKDAVASRAADLVKIFR